MSLPYHDMGLFTVIGKGATDASGNVIDKDTRMRMSRLRTWDNRSQVHSPTERSLQKAFFTLSRLKDRLGLPNHVTENAGIHIQKGPGKGSCPRRHHRFRSSCLHFCCTKRVGSAKDLGRNL